MENINEQTVNEQPTSDGQQPPEPPTFDGQEAPTSDGQQPPESPTFNGQQPPMMPPPPMFGQFMAPPPDMSMWGNESFAGEDVLNGNNFGAPADLSELTDVSGAGVNFGQENPFGGFAQGEMMLAGFGCGGQFAQPQQAAQETAAE